MLTKEQKAILQQALDFYYNECRGISENEYLKLTGALRKIPEHHIYAGWDRSDVIQAILKDSNNDTEVARTNICKDETFLTEVLEHFERRSGNADTGWTWQCLYDSINQILNERQLDLDINFDNTEREEC